MDQSARNRWVFRMIHYQNLEFILKHGIVSKYKENNPEYIRIGAPDLISLRDEYRVGIDPPGGTLGEFIPFYFAGHSPMLYKIKTGNGVRSYPQEDIIFICCKIGKIIDFTNEWCFTDGHAKSRITEFYNDLIYLSRIDWDTVNALHWNNTFEDMDRCRKKQAEFLVKDFRPVSCIGCLGVRNEERKVDVKLILESLNLNIPIYVDNNNRLYYE